jgi:hypothetical protein
MEPHDAFLALMFDGRVPWEYAGVKLKDVLSRIGVSMDEFRQIADRFTNRDIWPSPVELSRAS